jgi:hypothetical protein
MLSSLPSAASLPPARSTVNRRMRNPDCSTWRGTVLVGLVGTVCALVLLGLQLARLSRNDLGRDASAPFIVGTNWKLDEALQERGISVHLTPGDGYDGQWFLGQAYDPLLLARLPETFDMPQYRARRPLFSILGWLTAAGQPAAIPVAMLAVTVVSIGAGAAATAWFAISYQRSRWWGLTFAVIPGVIVANMFETAEALALALSLVGLVLVRRSRLLAAGIVFAAAGLTKETYLGFAVAAAGSLAWTGWRHSRSADLPAGAIARVRQLAGPVVLVIGPGAGVLAGWWAYVAVRISEHTSKSGLDAFTIPFDGWIRAVRVIADGRFTPDAPVGAGGAVLVLGSFLVILISLPLAIRVGGLIGWSGVLFGLYGLSIDQGILAARFLSAMRTVAPSMLVALLVLLAFSATKASGTAAAHRRTEVAIAAGPRSDDATSQLTQEPR